MFKRDFYLNVAQS